MACMVVHLTLRLLLFDNILSLQILEGVLTPVTAVG
jgi:hypothetical protein